MKCITFVYDGTDFLKECYGGLEEDKYLNYACLSSNLQRFQQFFQERLRRNGYLFLKEIIDKLCIKSYPIECAAIGWVWKPDDMDETRSLFDFESIDHNVKFKIMFYTDGYAWDCRGL